MSSAHPKLVLGLHPKLILGIAGNVACILMFLSPVPTFWKIYNNKSTQLFSGLPYAVTLFNCLLWVLYGLPMVVKDGILILTINAAGAAISLVFLAIFVTYADTKHRLRIARLVAVFVTTVLTVALVVLLAVHNQATRKLVVGSICVAVTILFYGSPLSVMKIVIQTKSVAFMPFLLSLFMTLNSACWTGYGLVSQDIFIMIPNGVGLVFGLSQLVLHAVYGRNKDPYDLEAVAPKVPEAVKVTELSDIRTGNGFVGSGFADEIGQTQPAVHKD